MLISDARKYSQQILFYTSALNRSTKNDVMEFCLLLSCTLGICLWTRDSLIRTQDPNKKAACLHLVVDFS